MDETAASAYSAVDRMVGENTRLKRLLADTKAERDNIYTLLWDANALNAKLAHELNMMRGDLTARENLVEDLRAQLDEAREVQV